MKSSMRFIAQISMTLLLAIGILACTKKETEIKTDPALEAPITAGYESAIKAHVTKPIFRPSGTAPAVWGPGDLYTLLATGEETNNAFFQFEAVVPTGGGPPPHVHSNEEETFYIVSGNLEILLGDKIYQAKAGDFVYVPRGTVHRFRNTGSETAIQLVTFVPSGMEKFFREVFPEAEDRTQSPPPITEEFIKKMNEAAQKHGMKIVPPPDNN